MDIYKTNRWQRISRYVRRERAGGVCEHCGVPHGAIAAHGRSLVRLECAHLNGNVRDLRPENLRALCTTCHRLYDQMRRLWSFFERHPELRGMFEARPRSRKKPTRNGHVSTQRRGGTNRE